MYKNNTDEFVLRYSSRFIYYTIFFGGAILLAFLLAFLAPIYILDEELVGQFARYASENDFYELATILIFVSIVLLAAFIFLLPFFTALKLTDKKALVLFNNHDVQINKGAKNIQIPYSDIRNIVFTTVLSNSKGVEFTSSGPFHRKANTSMRVNGNGFGPYLYRVKIETPEEDYKIHSSFNEAWHCRRHGVYPTLYEFVLKLSEKSGCHIDFKSNTFG